MVGSASSPSQTSNSIRGWSSWRVANTRCSRVGTTAFCAITGSQSLFDVDTDNPRAAMCIHWHSLEEQIRVEGRVERVSDAESDRYFKTRPRGSQLGAWASDQSAVLPSRETLEERYRETERRFDGKVVPRPPFWGGFRLIPDRIEFWFGRPDRLHDRLLYVREGTGWKIERLYP